MARHRGWTSASWRRGAPCQSSPGQGIERMKEDAPSRATAIVVQQRRRNIMGRTQTHSSPDVLSQLLESDDEDDAWLDKPTFLSQQSIPPTNSSSNDATVEEKDDGSSSSASSCSQEEKGEEQSTSQLESSSELPLIAKGAESDKDLAALLERADQQAKEAVDHSMDLKRRCDLSEVRWLQTKTKCYPVVLANQAERHVPLSQQGNKRAASVLFLGHSVWGDSWTEGSYSVRQLVPFYDPLVSEDLQEDDRVWHPKLLKKHIKALRGLKEFQDRVEFKLQLQKSYLKYALMRIRENQMAKREQAAIAGPTHDDEEVQNDSQDDGPEGEASVAVEPVHMTTTSSGARVAQDACHNDKPLHPLRAGDAVQFIPPTERADSQNKRTALIVTVHSKQDPIALELSDGTLLPPDHSVSVRARWLRRALRNHADKRYYCINEFRLDQSRNGQLDIESHSTSLARFMETSQNDVLRECRKRSAEDAGFSEEDIEPP